MATSKGTKIGQTQSGKDVFSNMEPDEYIGWTKADHDDARWLHFEHAKAPSGKPSSSKKGQRHTELADKHGKAVRIKEAKSSKMSMKDALGLINDHREATGHEPFTKLSKEEIEHHMKLIDDNAPYGNDPWGDVDESKVPVMESFSSFAKRTLIKESVRKFERELIHPNPGLVAAIKKLKNIEKEGDNIYVYDGDKHVASLLKIKNDWKIASDMSKVELVRKIHALAGINEANNASGAKIKPAKMVPGDYYDITLPNKEQLTDMEYIEKGTYNGNKPTQYLFRKRGGGYGDKVGYGISYLNQDNCIITKSENEPKVNEAATSNHPFSDVIKYFKQENPKVKISIKFVRSGNRNWPSKIYLITVDQYKFEFESTDGSHAERTNLLKTIGSIIDQGKNTSINPDYKKTIKEGKSQDTPGQQSLAGKTVRMGDSTIRLSELEKLGIENKWKSSSLVSQRERMIQAGVDSGIIKKERKYDDELGDYNTFLTFNEAKNEYDERDLGGETTGYSDEGKSTNIEGKFQAKFQTKNKVSASDLKNASGGDQLTWRIDDVTNFNQGSGFIIKGTAADVSEIYGDDEKAFKDQLIDELWSKIEGVGGKPSDFHLEFDASINESVDLSSALNRLANLWNKKRGIPWESSKLNPILTSICGFDVNTDHMADDDLGGLMGDIEESLAVEEMSEQDAKDAIIKVVKKHLMINEAKAGRPYFYIVDLDERGNFQAHVEDINGKEVFSIDDIDDFENIKDDGFMKHRDDTDGLEKHLKDMGILKPDDTLDDGPNPDLEEDDASINEGKNWDHDAVGKKGSISVFHNGVDKVSFEMDVEKQKWVYNAITRKGKKTGEVPTEYQAAFDDGHESMMTKIAKVLIKEAQ